jgi:glycosyltransferase involved in cell wall biosynthesis
MNVSIVMGACNPGPMLHETVESIRSNTDGLKCEIIVVNDMSTDGECDKLPPYVKLINSDKRLGCSGSRHMGINHASGEAVFICDPHIYLSPGSLRATFRKAMRSGPCIVMPRLVVEKHYDYGCYYAGIKISQRGFAMTRHRSHKRLYPGLGGAMYMINRETLMRLKNLPPLPNPWGGFELFWTGACYRLGVQIVYQMNVRKCVHRKYRAIMELPYIIPHMGREINEQWAMQILIPNFYKPLMEPLIRRHIPEIGWWLDKPETKRQLRMERWIRENAVMDESPFLEGPCRLPGLSRNPYYKELIGESVSDNGGL